MNLDALRAALKDRDTVRDAAAHAVELARDPANGDALPEIVTLLAEAIITPPTKRGRPRKLTANDTAAPASVMQERVGEMVNGHVALAEYTRLVNARDVADDRAPAFPKWYDELSKDDAIRYLKEWRIYAYGRSGIKARAAEKVCDKYGIRRDEFNALKKKFSRTFDRI